MPAGQRPFGRRTALTPDVIDTFRTALVSGCYFRDAAKHAGVAESSAYKWLATAEEAEPDAADYGREADYMNALMGWRICREFSEAVTKTEADAKIGALARIQQAGRNGSWQADAWFLERKYPQEFGRRWQELSAIEPPVEGDDARERLSRLLSRLDPSEATGQPPADPPDANGSGNGHAGNGAGA